MQSYKDRYKSAAIIRPPRLNLIWIQSFFYQLKLKTSIKNINQLKTLPCTEKCNIIVERHYVILYTRCEKK